MVKFVSIDLNNGASISARFCISSESNLSWSCDKARTGYCTKQLWDHIIYPA